MRDEFEPWRRLYRTARWRRLAERMKREARYTCKRCGVLAPGPYELDLDHVRPARADPAQFWSGPFEVLCRSCHSAKKADEARE